MTTGRAINAADKLSFDALRGMTAIWMIVNLGPHTPTAAFDYLDAATETADALLRMGLPDGHAWVDDLEALGLARIDGFLTRKPYRQMLNERAAAYLVPGIDAGASEALIESVGKTFPWINSQLKPHPLKPGFLVLPGTTAEDLWLQAPEDSARPPEVEQLVGQHGYGRRDATAEAKFVEAIEGRPPLVSVAKWWDDIPMCNLTLIGRAIGLVNARRHLSFRGVQTIAEMLEDNPAIDPA